VGAITQEQAHKDMAKEKQAFEGSATRSKQEGRYDLISPAGIHGMARRLQLGAERHGERNWESGGEKFRQATVSHLMAHLMSYMESPNADDADALICNAMFLCHFEEQRKEGKLGQPSN
jgi:hypothetical protein